MNHPLSNFCDVHCAIPIEHSHTTPPTASSPLCTPKRISWITPMSETGDMMEGREWEANKVRNIRLTICLRLCITFVDLLVPCLFCPMVLQTTHISFTRQSSRHRSMFWANTCSTSNMCPRTFLRLRAHGNAVLVHNPVLNSLTHNCTSAPVEMDNWRNIVVLHDNE